MKFIREYDDLALTLGYSISMLNKTAFDLAVDVTLRIRYVVKSLLELASETSYFELLRTDVVCNSFGHSLSLNDVTHGLLKLSIHS